MNGMPESVSSSTGGSSDLPIMDTIQDGIAQEPQPFDIIPPPPPQMIHQLLLHILDKIEMMIYLLF